MGVDWKKMTEGRYVKLEMSTPKVMTLTNWREQDTFRDDETGKMRQGLTFDVIYEDGKEFKDDDSVKIWTTTARSAIESLAPILMKAEAEGRKAVKVNVVLQTVKGKQNIHATEVNL